MSTNLDVHLMASLLLRQHAALMNEGMGPDPEQPGDKDLLNAAWELMGDEFGVHWGYEYGFVLASDHHVACDCTAALVWRGVLTWCRGCQKHQSNPHECRADYAVRWLTS